ncbi:serine/threonine-protein kinase spk-1-like [Drosophila biarmipes]|uniref:serine/threonine-protein kinase spk-1-like n=1 Tax=Drosophila biarmipes TaxID=125945 RepID=UPI0021CCE75A|nr:serine/threonine-protein kinase spk-1-like [Drosophila biarmipes]XP_050746119.1 serine/threonine-protein kinase spk-1-like [Drosophila biarmipes]XP_050746128.1 serine/threonine-protein kinase spk-1-like [Drosophila biarmipes]XP_050746139.1 serine/threonine-protein kinase spk-1-like [Drosophila biarmipes]XP_050746150.1 serine/threonine-protein kinase spk-1-like [Drosophila biarmipes]
MDDDRTDSDESKRKKDEKHVQKHEARGKRIRCAYESSEDGSEGDQSARMPADTVTAVPSGELEKISANESAPADADADPDPDPVNIGDVLHHRYHAIKKLGWGHFSTVWLCFDCSMECYCAVKVVKSADHFTETARDEIRLLCAVDDFRCHPLRKRVVEFIDHFYMTGANGSHLCLVFEVLGDNLFTLIQKSRYRGLPLGNIKQIAMQVLEGLYFLHYKCRIIHTDLKPENVLVVNSDAAVRGQVNQTINTFLKAQSNLRRSGHGSARGSLSDRERDRCVHHDCTKMTKTAKRKQRARVKRLVTFFLGHRRWLRREAIDDLLSLAKRGQLSRSTAVKGVTGKLSFMPFNFDGLQILSARQVEKIENLPTVERVGDVPAQPPKREPNGERNDNRNGSPDRKSKSNRKGEPNRSPSRESNRNHNGEPNGQSNRDRRARPRRREEREPSNDGDSVTSSGEDSVDPVGLLISSPEEFMRYTLQKVKLSDRKAECPHQWPPKRSARRGSSSRRNSRHKKKSGSVVPNPAKYQAYMRSKRESNLLGFLQGKDPATESCEVHVKIADMGNGCWFDHHFTEDIQTREYRAVEVILGAGYNETADIWSAACMFWELATGDYLFIPKANRGRASVDEAHIASIIEICGAIPRHVVESGDYSSEIFKSNGQLRHIAHLKTRKLTNILVNQYGWPRQEARHFVTFLRPMLDTDPNRRMTAREALNSCWLSPKGCDCCKDRKPKPRRSHGHDQERRMSSEEAPRPGTPDPRSDSNHPNEIKVLF